MLEQCSSLFRRAHESVVFARKFVSFVSIFEYMQNAIAGVIRCRIIHMTKIPSK